MTQASVVQGLLKNTDLLLDAGEIRSVVESVRDGRRPLELHAANRVWRAQVADVLSSTALQLTLQDDAGAGWTELVAGMPVVILLNMGGYSLETRLKCLEVSAAAVRVEFPALFRVHSKRQVSRFSVPMNMTCAVEMRIDAALVAGELQDLNLEGLSFLGDPIPGGAGANSPVQVRLLPADGGDPSFELTGILRFSGRESQPGVAGVRFRHSVQLTGASDPEAFRRYFGKISSSSHGWFRAAVISAESYRQTSAI